MGPFEAVASMLQSHYQDLGDQIQNLLVVDIEELGNNDF